MLLQIDVAGGSRTTSDSHRLRGRRHRDSPLRSVPSAGGRPRLHADAQGDHRSPRNPNGPVQRSACMNSTSESLEEQLRGRPQFASGSWALGSSWIHRPRVEWSGRGTPSRTACVRLAGTATIGKPTGCSGISCHDTIGGSASRRLSLVPYRAPGVSLDAVLCFKYLRTVANDNTVHFNGAALQVLPDGLRASYARARVEVQVGRQHPGLPSGQVRGFGPCAP